MEDDSLDPTYMTFLGKDEGMRFYETKEEFMPAVRQAVSELKSLIQECRLGLRDEGCAQAFEAVVQHFDEHEKALTQHSDYNLPEAERNKAFDTWQKAMDPHVIDEKMSVVFTRLYAFYYLEADK